MAKTTRLATQHVHTVTNAWGERFSLDFSRGRNYPSRTSRLFQGRENHGVSFAAVPLLVSPSSPPQAHPPTIHTREAQEKGRTIVARRLQ